MIKDWMPPIHMFVRAIESHVRYIHTHMQHMHIASSPHSTYYVYMLDSSCATATVCGADAVPALLRANVNGQSGVICCSRSSWFVWGEVEWFFGFFSSLSELWRNFGLVRFAQTHTPNTKSLALACLSRAHALPDRKRTQDATPVLSTASDNDDETTHQFLCIIAAALVPPFPRSSSGIAIATYKHFVKRIAAASQCVTRSI